MKVDDSDDHEGEAPPPPAADAPPPAADVTSGLSERASMLIGF